MAAKKRVVAAKKQVVAPKRTSTAAARVTKTRAATSGAGAPAAAGAKRAVTAASTAKQGPARAALAKPKPGARRTSKASPDEANGSKPTPKGKGATKSKPAARQVADSVSAGGAIGVGAAAPAFELSDQHGEAVSSAALAGQPYVLYFYPKNDTPGCTTEACGFRDAFSDFERIGVRVVGVSPDSVNSHRKFADKYGLPFTLLSDGAQELASRYGVWALKKNYGREYMGIVRSTFLVDADGVVRKAWRGVRVNGHAPEVATAAAEIARA